MNDRQTRYLNKYRELNGVFANYETEVGKYSIVQQKVDAFKSNISAIIAEAKKTAANTTGITSGKGATKKAMAGLAAELASGALAYANDTGDAQLQADFSVTRSDILYAKDADALNMVRVLEEDLRTNEEALSGYLITGEDIDQLEGLADQFEALDETQGSTQASSKTAHRKLKQLFRQTQSLLADQLDQLMTRLQRKEPDLVSDYFNVRGRSIELSFDAGSGEMEN